MPDIIIANTTQIEQLVIFSKDRLKIAASATYMENMA